MRDVREMHSEEEDRYIMQERKECVVLVYDWFSPSTCVSSPTCTGLLCIVKINNNKEY